MQAIFETAFDITYLLTVLILGIIMIKRSDKQSVSRMFGIMVLVLGVGDAFHLIPRVYGFYSTGLEANTAALGIGKLITSITMTAFYIILYYIWRKRYEIKGKKFLSILICLLGIIRIVMLLLPQNRWITNNSVPLFGVYRNIPFVIMGGTIIFLFYKYARLNKDKTFKYMYLAILLSFAFYIPVVLFARMFPMVGMLMIPKTICYVWIAVMGYKTLSES